MAEYKVAYELCNLHKFRNNATLEVVDIIIWLMKNRLLDECIPMLT